MNIAVFGIGYVGIVTAVCFADAGNKVIGVDLDEKKIQLLRQGISPIYEPGLDELLQKNISAGLLELTTDFECGIKSASIIFIAVGTPSSPDGSTDLNYVMKVAETIGRHMNSDKTIVMKSTVPVGTCKLVQSKISAIIADRGLNYKFEMVSNPEFLREGNALHDSKYPDRVIIGVDSEQAAISMKKLYQSFVGSENQIQIMDLQSSELTKYAANSMLATRISFMNDLSHLCEKAGADIEYVKKGIGADRRIGPLFLNAGVGYGGSCFPKDVRALINTAKAFGAELTLLPAVQEVNTKQKRRFFDKIKAHFQHDLKGKQISVWGLAFKPDTDDIREAPALEIIEWLAVHGAKVVAHDPIALENAKTYFERHPELSKGKIEQILFAKNHYSALEGSDCLVILTEWAIYKNSDLSKMRSLLRSPVVFDGRNVFLSDMMQTNNFNYQDIGRYSKSIR